MKEITVRFRRYTAKGLKRIITGLTVFSCMAATAQTLLWSDEFDTGSVPDPAIWAYDTGAGGWGNQEYQNYTSNTNNVKVEGGNLIITARKTSATTFTSGRIKTLNKLTFQYGTIEARIKTPDLANGLWPAFWTLGNNYPTVGWPRCGEIDIMEMGHADAIAAGLVNRRVGSTAHWQDNGFKADYGRNRDMASGINDTFVTYRMEWTPSSITTYINDLFIWSIDITPIVNPYLTEFHEPHFLILNMAVGGEYPDIYGPGNQGNITALPNTGDTAEYVIDYIRLYDNGYTIMGGTGAPNIPPEFIENPIIRPDGLEGSFYLRTIADAATDADAGDTLTFSKVSGPAWLQINGNGSIVGTPQRPDIGTNTWAVMVDDGNGGTNTAALQIFIEKLNDPPVFNDDPFVMPNAVEGAGYLKNIAGSATDVDGDTLTYSKVSGPSWLSVAGSGIISGLPGSGDIGLNSWTVEVTDGTNAPVSATLEITVESSTPSPVLSIQMSGSNIEVRWPSSYTGYNLNSSTGLQPPVTWSAVTNAPIIDGDDWMVAMPIAGAPPFFRLESP